MSDDELTIAWDGADGRRLAELRALFLERSEGGGAAVTRDYWTCERDLELYDATLGARVGWRWDRVLEEATRRGAGCSRKPAETVVDLGCGSGVASRAAWRAGWIAPGARVHCVDRSTLATAHAASRLRAIAPDMEVHESALMPRAAPELLLIGHLVLEVDDRAFGELIESARRAGTTVWIEPGTRFAGRRLSEVHEALRDERSAVAPCPHAARCGLLDEGRERDWCHHFPEPPADAFTEPLPGKTAHELGLDIRSLATSYLVLQEEVASLPGDVGRVLGRPKIEKGRARVDLCTASGVARLDLAKRDDPRLWRAWKRPGRERLLYHVDVDGSRLRSARAFDEEIDRGVSD